MTVFVLVLVICCLCCSTILCDNVHPCVPACVCVHVYVHICLRACARVSARVCVFVRYLDFSGSVWKQGKVGQSVLKHDFAGPVLVV